jgi:hypothetical protein
MRLVQRVALLATAALLTLSLGTAVASADALKQGGAAVAVGFGLNLTSTNVVITGAFANPVSCTGSGIASTITSNNVAFSPARADLNNWTFAGCTLPGGAACAVFVNAVPWANAVGLRNGPPKTFSISIPPGALLSVACGGMVCSYTGAAAVPPASVTGAWSDSPSTTTPATVQFVNAPLAHVAGACPVAGAIFTATYQTTTNAMTLTA